MPNRECRMAMQIQMFDNQLHSKYESQRLKELWEHY